MNFYSLAASKQLTFGKNDDTIANMIFDQIFKRNIHNQMRNTKDALVLIYVVKYD